MKTCSIENCNNRIWSKGLCKNHIIKKPIISDSRINRMSTLSNNKRNIQQIQQMRDFFLSIWNKRIHVSEVSEKKLSREPLHTYFHHILSKEKYPEAAFDEENIILLTLDEHTNVENDMYRYKIINDLREKLKLKYERIKQGEKV